MIPALIFPFEKRWIGLDRIWDLIFKLDPSNRKHYTQVIYNLNNIFSVKSKTFCNSAFVELFEPIFYFKNMINRRKK
ncbi:hypothetical protein LEP1GSC060_1954 [Leptospira weilii serovar Ranarum str. ICFT]|uniref:Uncharacterized protein n=1 Tax=Leptospira weilii serovar Ranarum str. ICFT TaxID=1218598 RepID=N1WL25_9LEPT|nr:hypothetical protein LEP1GSC060_1954 [Leptospira weilii serovar Ranarum str. ICFT]